MNLICVRLRNLRTLGAIVCQGHNPSHFSLADAASVRAQLIRVQALPTLPDLFASAPLTMTCGFFTSRLQSSLDGSDDFFQAGFDRIAVGAKL